MSRSSRAVAATVATLALSASGCGSSSSGGSRSSTSSTSSKAVSPNAPEAPQPGDIPDNQAYVAYTPPGSKLSIKVPEGWARRAAGGATVFTDHFNSIRVETVSAHAPLTVRDAKQTEVPKLAKANQAFRLGTVGTVARPAGKAIRITYLTNTPPDPVTGKRVRAAVERYVFFHGGHDIVLTLTGAKGADNVDPWRIVTSSVRYGA
jgi:hypothetical protein